MSKQQTASIMFDGARGTVKCSINVVLIPPLDSTVDSVILHLHPTCIKAKRLHAIMSGIHKMK